MESMPDKLVRLIAARDDSQARVARAIGVDASQFAKWLKGKGQPTVPHVLALARYFGVTMEYLADDSVVDPPAPPPDLAPDERTVLTTYRVLRDAGKVDVEGAIRGMVGPPVYDPEILSELAKRRAGRPKPA